jgi:uncharacterized protein with ParB-like and HNH nuclease domain
VATKDDFIDFEQLGIGTVLKRYRLRVPKYQRDYAWTSAQVEAFLQDITSAIQIDEPQYFLGTIVTIKRESGELEVVDGQQRLATTSLVLAALRNLAGQANQKLYTLITNFLSSINTATLEEDNQLALNLADSEVFRSLVVEGVTGKGFVKNRESHMLLSQAYEMAKKHLEELGKAAFANNLTKLAQQWIEFLEQRAKTILLKVSDDSSAFRMFETLNDRGLSVSQADLIKNYVFKESAQNFDQVQQFWTSIRSTLENVDDESSTINFIWHALIATTGFVEQKKMYDRVKSTIKGKNSSLTELANWDKLAKYYTGISNPFAAIWQENKQSVERQIKVLNLLDIQPFRPILMASAVKMEDKELSMVFTKMIAVGVRLLVASRTTTQSVFQPLSVAANKIWKGEIKTAAKLVEFLVANIPNDAQFQSAFEVATVSRAKLARYYLRTLEQVSKGEKEPWESPNEDANDINLEHILPRNPKANWPAFSQDQADAHLKRLGNMALIQKSKNKELGNGTFAEKKKVFLGAQFETTKMVASFEDWNPDNVLARQKQLAELALKAWPLK